MSKYHTKCTETDAVPKSKTKKPTPPVPPQEHELLAALNPNRPCCCEAVSRALRDDLPKILGMSSHRAALQIGPDELLDCNPDIKLGNPSPSNTNDSQSANCARPPKGT